MHVSTHHSAKTARPLEAGSPHARPFVPSSLQGGPAPLPTAGPWVLPETTLSGHSTNPCGRKAYFLKWSSHYWIMTTRSIYPLGKWTQQEVNHRDFFRGIVLLDLGLAQASWRSMGQVVGKSRLGLQTKVRLRPQWVPPSAGN